MHKRLLPHLLLILLVNHATGLRFSMPTIKSASATSARARCTVGMTETVSLNEILSTCVHAAQRGCEAIRAVQARRNAGAALAVTHKVEADAKSALTEADLSAQTVIISGLRAAWPGLRIVGEEDEGAAEAAEADGGEPEPLRLDLCPDALPDRRVDLSDVVVFVDPLDGTREFVERRLDKVRPPSPPRRNCPWCGRRATEV